MNEPVTAGGKAPYDWRKIVAYAAWICIAGCAAGVLSLWVSMLGLTIDPQHFVVFISAGFYITLLYALVYHKEKRWRCLIPFGWYMLVQVVSLIQVIIVWYIASGDK